MTFIQPEEFVTAPGYACILSSATLNTRWASLTFSLRVCSGPTLALCFFWTIPSCNSSNSSRHTENVADCGQWNAQAEMRIDPEDVGWGNYHLKSLSPATKRFKRDGNGLTLITSWLVMTLISPIVFPVNTIMTSSFRANMLPRASPRRAAGFSCTSAEREKKIFNSQIWNTSTSFNLYCQANIFPARQTKGRTLSWAGVGAKYFNNSSLTVRKRPREQEVWQGSVLDAVGAAARGDRLVCVCVLHEEVSENISNRMNKITRNDKSEKWAKATRHVDQRGIHRVSTYTPAGTRCAWGEVGKAGREELLLSQTTWPQVREPSRERWVHTQSL